MKKTKLLTSIAALALVLGLGACEVNVDVGGVEVGDVDVGVDVNPDGSSEDNTSENTSGDVCEHQWGEWETKQEPTCTEDGYQERVCSLCGEPQTMTLPATGHTWGATGTPNNNGTHTLTCTVCNATETAECEFGDWADKADGTAHERTCTVCGYSTTGTDDNPSDTGDHRYRSGEYASDENGHWRECTMCGHKESDPAAHAYEFVSTDTQHWKACSVCGYIDEATITAHTYEGEYQADERGHYQVCECGHVGEIDAHDSENTETGPLSNGYQHGLGTCSTCGFTVAEPHQVISNTNPTCSVCGATNLNVEGLTYTVSDGKASVSYGVTDDPVGTEEVALFVPATYDDGTNQYPVTSLGTATGTSLNASTLGNALRWYTYIGLPEGLTEIGNYSLNSGQYNDTRIKSLCVPSTVTSIGDYAVYYANSLEEVEFAEGSQLTTIGQRGFMGCAKLSYIELPETVTEIGQNIFSNCDALTEARLGSITTIPSSAFNKDTKLTDVLIPDTCTYISGSAFSGCTGLESIVIPDSVETIYDSAFDGCTNLNSIVIGSGVKTLGYALFGYSNTPTSLTVYYNGTEAEWNSISFAYSSVSDSFQGVTNLTILYSDQWEYVDGIPTPLA